MDVSVTDPLQMANLAVQGRFIAGSTHLREVVKINKYSNLLKSNQFCPFVLQSSGGIGNRALQFLKFVLQSSGGIGNRALQFLNGMRHQPPAVGVWHPDSFVDSLVRKASSIALKAKVKLMRRWMCLALNSEHRIITWVCILIHMKEWKKLDSVPGLL